MWRPILQIVFIFWVALIPLRGSAQEHLGQQLRAEKATAVDKAIQAEMARQEVIGVAVGIIQDGQVVYLKGYGQANREKRIPVTTETVFNWASNSKPLTAVAAMQLVDQKLLDLDADVRNYVPEFPDKGKVITSRHLLSHQSGIPHYSNGKVVPTQRQYSTDHSLQDPIVALDKFNQSPLLFNPGEKTSYSSYAYILLSAVVQRAGKAPFSDQIQDRIAKPLALKSLQIDIETKTEPNWATGYIKKDGKISPAADMDEYWKQGAGAYKSNIGDFAGWAEALVNHKLVSKEAEKQMWTPQKTSSGETSTYGLGFAFESKGELKVAHNGQQTKATSRLVLYPKSGHGVVILSNCEFANLSTFSTAVYSALNRK